MGLNISIYKIIDRTLEQSASFGLVPVYHTSRQEWFDYHRFSGDSDFVSENEFYFVDLDADNELQRPIDFDRITDWININIPECNKSRLLQAIDKMKDDKSLVFCFSF